jgi:site-specific DNA-adenine methylase
MSLNYIVYPGNKTPFLDTILKLTNSVKNSVSSFYEIFAGSGTVSLHLSPLFLHIILNDLDYHIFKIHSAFKYGSYEELHEIIEEIWSFGNPVDVKEDYYSARTALNKKYYKKDTGNREGFYYWTISTFAINSLMRFGPSGFNQGWGNRGLGRVAATRAMGERKFNEIHNAYKDIDLFNIDGFELLKDCDEKTLIFVDPPYVDKGSGTYSFTQEQHDKLIDILKNWCGPVMYTDVFSEERLQSLGSYWNYKILRTSMGSGKPGKSNYSNVSEAIYFNFKEKNTSIALF